EGICTIDSDPWLEAQDGDIETPVRYSWKEASATREEGICTIDSDPWLEAQDGDIETPVRYSWKEASAT
ncbi:hypothetical protein C7E25_25390, partial [Stenotrophomonas maltophilia]